LGVVSRKLAVLLKDDPEQAVRLFLKAREQVAADRKAGTKTTDMSGMAPGSILGYVLSYMADHQSEMRQAGDPMLPRVIAALTAMLATDQGCGVESNQAFFARVGDLLVKAGTPPGKNGKFTVHLLRETVGPVLQPEWLPALAGAARSMMWTVGTPETLTWLQQQAKDGPHRDFAMLLVLGTTISAQQKSKQPCAGIMAVEQLPAEQRWLLHHLEKKSLAPAVLASCAGEVLRAWPGAEPPLRYACVQALAAAWNQDVPVDETRAEYVAESLVLLAADAKMQEDAGFKSAARALLQVWLQRIAKTRPVLYGWPATQTTDRPLLRRMMTLALEAGLYPEADGITRAVEADTQNELSPAWAGMLVQFRQFDAARRVLVRTCPWLGPYDTAQTHIGRQYTAGVREALPDLLALYENAAERYRAEVILRGLPDSNEVVDPFGPEVKIEESARDARLLALAKAWPGDDVYKLPDAMSLLARLLATPGGEEALAPVLERFRKAKPLTDHLPGDLPTNETSALGRVIGTLMKQRIAAGDAELLLTFCKSVLQTQQNHFVPSGNAQVVAAVWLHALAAMKPQWPKSDEATRKKVRETGSALLRDAGVRVALGNSNAFSDRDAYYNGESNEVATCYVHLYWLALTAGEMKEFHATMESALKDTAVESGVREMELEKILPALLQPWPAEAPNAARKRSQFMLQWILAGGELPGFAVDGDHWFRRVIKAGWLRPEDVLAKAEAIIAKRERGGNTVTELLEIAVEAKREDVAAKIRQLMEERSPK
jgi:hypothetical protein